MKFSSNLDIQKTIEICRKLCREDELNQDDDAEGDNVGRLFPEANPFQELYNADHIMNDDLRLATLNKLGAIAKKRDNLMSNEQFYELMRMANQRQKALLMHVIANLLSSNRSPLQVFFTGPAGCGKTFLIRLLMLTSHVHQKERLQLQLMVRQSTLH